MSFYLSQSCSGFCSETLFRRAYYDFIGQLQVQWVCSCPVCGDTPNVLIGDATMICITQTAYTGQSITAKLPNGPVICSPGHQRSNRSFTGSARTNSELELLAVYVQGTGCSPRTGKRKELPASWDVSSVCCFSDGKMNAAFLVLGSIATLGMDMGSRDKLAVLISCLASQSAVCSYFATPIASVMHECITTGCDIPAPHVMTAIAKQAPIVHAALEVLIQWLPISAGTQFSLQSEPWRTLFLHLCSTSIRCHSVPEQCGDGEVLGLQEPQHLEEQPSWVDGTCLHTGICSGVRRVRDRLPCVADGRAGSQAQACREPRTDKAPCRHTFFNAGDRTGGVFTWFCEHGVCYAVYIIPNAEGRDEAFSFLTKYFPKAPKVIVYDFACALEEYCLNRAPEFFKDTLFVVDNFHWRNHVSCGLGYCMARYTFLSNVNSQVAEQCNSALKKIKPALGRMLQSNFMAAIRLFLHSWNVSKCSKLLAREEHNRRVQGRR